jgi:hypothetical protein
MPACMDTLSVLENACWTAETELRYVDLWYVIYDITWDWWFLQVLWDVTVLCLIDRYSISASCAESKK